MLYDDIEFIKSTHTTAEIDSAVDQVPIIKNQILSLQNAVLSLQDTIATIQDNIETLTTRIGVLESSAVLSTNVRHILKITQSDYDALATKDENTQYNIV